MTGLEDFQEAPAKPTNHAPTIALTVAAVLLLIVAGMSYHSYMEKKYEDKNRHAAMGYPQGGPYMANNQQGYYPQQGNYPNQMGNQQGAYLNNVPYNQGQMPAYPQQQQQQGQFNPNGYPKQQQGQMPPPQQQQGAYPNQNNIAGQQGTQQSQYQPNLPSENNLPRPNAQIEQMEEDLARAKAQANKTADRYNQLSEQMDRKQQNSGADDSKKDATAEAIEYLETMPSFLEEALENPPNGRVDLMETMKRMKKLVSVSPSMGRVLSYDSIWGVVTFNAGAASGVQEKQRFAVRRGSEILGWVRVEEVHENESVAVLVTKNAQNDLSMKPQVGDDLILFEL